MLAKLQGAERKRKRKADEDEDDEDGDGDVDMDMEGGEDGWEDDTMDIDGEDTPKRKKVRGNNGAVAVVAAGGRGPRTDRRFAGMRDEGVSIYLEGYDLILILFLGASAIKSCCQVTQSGAAPPQYAGQGWRGGSSYSNKNGMYY
jgi:hypothetical protein